MKAKYIPLIAALVSAFALVQAQAQTAAPAAPASAQAPAYSPSNPGPGWYKHLVNLDFVKKQAAIPKVDGQSIDRIYLGFAGGVWLDRSDPNDVALYNRLRFGADVTLQIEGRYLAQSSEIDLGVNRGGGWVTMPEKVPDHLHRQALVQKMLGCSVS